MTAKYPPLPAALLALIASACAHAPVNGKGEWSEAQQAAYEQCLEDNMAAAVAWEMIEQSCREQVEGEADPLRLRAE